MTDKRYSLADVKESLLFGKLPVEHSQRLLF